MIKPFTTTLILSTVVLGTTVGHSLAQPTDQLNQEVLTLQFNPPDEGLPDNTTGGASRNPDLCRRQYTATKASNLTLLAPNSFIGLTVAEHPSFYIYANQTLSRQLFISLEDEQGEPLYQGIQTLSTNTGLISVDLPVETPILETGHTYLLSVVPICGESLRPDDPILTGYVQRVLPPQTSETDTSISSFGQARLYAESGIWYDTLALLGQDLSNEPNNEVLINAWESLLTSGGLTEIPPYLGSI